MVRINIKPCQARLLQSDASPISVARIETCSAGLPDGPRVVSSLHVGIVCVQAICMAHRLVEELVTDRDRRSTREEKPARLKTAMGNEEP